MADDELDDFDLDEDDAPSGESGVPAPTDYDDDDDFDFDDDFDESGGGGGGKFAALLEGKKKLIMIGTAAVVGLGAIGGGAYWYFMGDDTSEMAEEAGQSRGGVGGAVGMALNQQATTGLTPQAMTAGGVTAGKLTQGGGKLTAGAASGKLTAGGPTGGKLTAGGAGMTAGVSAAAGASGMGGYDPENTETPLSTAAIADVGINIPAVLPQAVASLGQPVQPQPLAPPNDLALFEKSSVGDLPVVSPEGKQAWQTYARPFNADPATPLVGLVVTGLGMSATMTQAAIDHLPADVTLAFSPYGSGVKGWVEKARAAGHEVLLELPMESDSFPVDDPGPMAMMTTKSPSENLKLLNLLMAQAQGYVGFIGQHGSKFTKNKKAMAPVLGEIKSRGLFFVDPRSTDGTLGLEMADQMQLPRAIMDGAMRTDATADQIRAQLETLATIAGSKRIAAAMIEATPNSIKAIKNWAGTLQSARLAPTTSLAGRQQQ